MQGEEKKREKQSRAAKRERALVAGAKMLKRPAPLNTALSGDSVLSVSQSPMSADKLDVVEALSLMPRVKRTKSSPSSSFWNNGTLIMVKSPSSAATYPCVIMEAWQHGTSIVYLVRYANGKREWIDASSQRIIECEAPESVTNTHIFGDSLCTRIKGVGRTSSFGESGL